jgi:hypothetical protein
MQFAATAVMLLLQDGRIDPDNRIAAPFSFEEKY